MGSQVSFGFFGGGGVVANWRGVHFIHGFQACQLLKLLCKELGADFEIFAESFVPVSPSVPSLLLLGCAG